VVYTQLHARYQRAEPWSSHHIVWFLPVMPADIWPHLVPAIFQKFESGTALVSEEILSLLSVLKRSATGI